MLNRPSSLRMASSVEIELVYQDDVFLGLGRVSSKGHLLRKGRRPMFVEIRNPYGVSLCEYQLQSVTQTDAEIEMRFGMKHNQSGMMEWMLHTVRNRYIANDWTQSAQPAEDTHLSLTLKPVQQQFGSEEFTGFHYQYRYNSRTIPIYKILDRGTWEIGGTTMDNQFWFRNSHMPPITTFTSLEQHYSSEWYLPIAENPNIFQFIPLQTQLQGFTFTVSDTGVLVTWATEVAHIRTLIEKPRGSDELVHWHEHCADLDTSLVTAPVEVLWSPGRRNRTELINLYERVREHVWGALHRQINMRQERVTTYGVIEEWEDPDLDYYTCEGVPKLLEAGVKTIFLANHFQNNMNVYGVSNMCCTVDYTFAENQESVKALCDAAHAGGAKVEMWGNTSVSTLTLILSNRSGKPKRVDFPDQDGSIMQALSNAAMPWVKNPSNAIEADHYTPVFAVLNLREAAVRAYWHDRWRMAREQVGLDGIFLDSSFNLSSDKFHFLYSVYNERSGATLDQTQFLSSVRPAQVPQALILSQYRAHLDLMVEMQRYGYGYCGEDTGVFGISRSGPDANFRLDNLFMWVETLVDFNAESLQEMGCDPDAIYFQGLAYRMMWKLYWNIKHNMLSFAYSADDYVSAPTDWHLAVLQAYNRVNDDMVNREVLPEEAGILYRSGKTQVLWAFDDVEHPLAERAHIKELISKSEFSTSVVQAKRHHIYLIST